MAVQRHRLLRIDPESRRALCTWCGWTKIKNKGKSQTGRQQWKCAGPGNVEISNPHDHSMIVCPSCEEPRWPNEYPSREEGRRAACCEACHPKGINKDKERMAAYMRQWRKDHPNWQRERRLYGLTMEDWERLSQEPCPICLRSEQKMCVDHDHDTGKARGVICTTCNRAMGLLGDDSDRLDRAATYLNMLTSL